MIFTSTGRLIIDYFLLVDYFISRLLVDYRLVDGSLSPSDRAMRLVFSNLANYLETVQKLLIRQVLTASMI